MLSTGIYLALYECRNYVIIFHRNGPRIIEALPFATCHPDPRLGFMKLLAQTASDIFHILAVLACH